tara:strand:- start:2440 stop:3060 length:621 start_codon:yes stop_codon:yes gene_type:complete
MKKIGVIDYGMGNINSVVNALKYLGVEYKVTNSSSDLKNLSMLILPGVGSFKKAFLNLENLNLTQEIKNQVLIKKKKILGICLGMQLLGSSSTEDGYTKGLEFINNKVTKFEFSAEQNLRVPHVGFNNIKNLSENFSLFKNIKKKDNFYFVHSYKMVLEKNNQYALSEYGIEFLAAYQKENIFGVQFHPEKSQSSGIQLLSNFISC